MFGHVIEKGHRMIGGGCLLGEIVATVSNDRVQQLAFLAGGAIVWLSHFVWDQQKRKRDARDADRKSQRTNGILDVLASRVKADIKDGKPLPYPELVRFLVDHDDADDRNAKDDAK